MIYGCSLICKAVGSEQHVSKLFAIVKCRCQVGDVRGRFSVRRYEKCTGIRGLSLALDVVDPCQDKDHSIVKSPLRSHDPFSSHACSRSIPLFCSQKRT